MKVKCINVSLENVNAKVYSGLTGYNSDFEFLDLTVGDVFTVYGISTIHCYPWYLLKSKHRKHALYYPMCLFSIVDDRLSKHWKIRIGNDYYDNNIEIVEFGFYDPKASPCLYGSYLEGDPLISEWFIEKLRIMDVEFDDKFNPMTAVMIDGNWLLCPNCGEAFESNSNDGLVICHKCSSTMNNPLWSSNI